MATPTLQWYSYVDDPENPGTPKQSDAEISCIDFGNVQPTYFSKVQAVAVKFTGSTVNTPKFWMSNWVPTEGDNSNVSYYHQDSDKWDHRIWISDSWVNPANSVMTESIKGGLSDIPGHTGERFERTPEEEPADSNFETDEIASGSFTDYIYLNLKPPTNCSPGLTLGWGFKLSFLFP